MTDLPTGNGHDMAGGLEPPVTRPRTPRDPTGAARAKRYRDARAARSAVTVPPGTITDDREKTNDFNTSVTVARHAAVRPDRDDNRDGKNASVANGVTPFTQPRWQVGDSVAHAPPGWGVTVATTIATLMLAAVGITLSLVGMVETATYALAVGGVLFCTLAVVADVLTLTMPSVAGALWRRRSPAVILAVLLWCAGAAVTVANLAGYVGEHVESYQNGRQSLATARDLALERLARLRDERKAIGEGRPVGAIAVALNDARRSERPALRAALAMAKRRDILDFELATFEQRLDDIPQVATADASAAVLSDITGMAISERELRRLRLALLLGLPLCGGLVLSLAFAVRRRT
jgi:hypothetical protein